MLGGAGVVTLVWAAQVRPSARPDELFATAAHLTGLLAGYGVLVLLFLMARVPAVEHGVGADRLARWHAFGGRYVLLLCFGHGLFALLGYAVHEGGAHRRPADPGPGPRSTSSCAASWKPSPPSGRRGCTTCWGRRARPGGTSRR